MRVLIFGCGRTGSALGLMLDARGHHVTILEQNPDALIRLGDRHGIHVVIGSGLDEDVLAKGGIREADAFFAVTRGDNTNIMAGQIARLRYNVQRVCIKCADPLRAEAFRKLGYVCINPSSLSAGMMRDWLLGAPYETVDRYNDFIRELEL